METKTLDVDAININGGTQTRASLNQDTVAEYTEVLKDTNGSGLPPVDVVFDGSTYWLWDGFHRYNAHRNAGLGTIKASVTSGSKRDALLKAIGANADHGLKRTNADKRRAVTMLLNDEEWSQKSDRWIAEKANVSNTFVGTVREQSGVNVDTSKRQGKDGKKYPDGSQQTRQDQIDDYFNNRGDSPPPASNQGVPSPSIASVVKDASGRDVPAAFRVQHALGSSIDSVARKLDTVKRDVEKLADEMGGEWLDTTQISGECKKLKGLISHSRYWSHCPRCDGKNTSCDLCDGAGWIPFSRRGLLTALEKQSFDEVSS